MNANNIFLLFFFFTKKYVIKLPILPRIKLKTPIATTNKTIEKPIPIIYTSYA